MESSKFYCSNNIDEKMRPPSKLMQSLFELCVIIGLDEDTGLVAKKTCKGSNVSNNADHSDKSIHSVFDKSHQPSILAVLSAEIASFPFTEKQIHGEPYYRQENIAFNTQGPLTPTHAHGKLRFAKSVKLPFENGVIFTLREFCLPGGAFIFETRQEDSIHTLVMTDIDGRRSYCTCLKFYRQYYIKEPDPFIPEKFLLLEKEPPNCEGQCQICFVPMCCCLISRFPYFQIAKDCLSSFLPVLNQGGNEMRYSMMKLFSQLCLVPIPPPGPVTIEFEICGQKHFVRPPGAPKKHIIDMEFHLPFLCFSVDKILLLLSCILTQKRIIFLSSDYSLLTPIAEALLSYIQPLEWGLTYVPVLPNNLVDLLEAPGSYIMGCHSDHYSQVFQLLDADQEGSGIVVADIDEGEVMVEQGGIPLIPDAYQLEFKQRIKQCKFHFDLAVTSSISVSNINELKKRRQVFNQHCANDILDACLQLMLNIFSDFGNFIMGGDGSSQVLFDRVAFVDSKPEQDREFFTQLCSSPAFSTYLCHRYEEDEVDFFSSAMSETEQVTSVNYRKRSVTSTTSLTRRSKPSNLLSFQNEEVFVLTPFVNEGLHTRRFYENCIKDLTSLLRSSEQKSSSYKACCLYLRGMMFIANGQVYEALDDFFALHAKSVQIFPTNIIVEILSQFDAKSLETFRNKTYFRRIDLLLRKYKKIGNSRRSRKQLTFDRVPRYTVGKTEFVEHVLLCQITENAGTAERLFEALVSGTGGRSVDPGTFSGLCEILNRADLEAQSVDIQGISFEKQEFVIKVSSLCKTDLGVGRLVLTNIRVAFMADGGSNCKHVARLLDIAGVENYQYVFLLPPGAPSLRITMKEKSQKAFTACLKGERDLWCCYLKEMIVCHERAEAFKDSQFVSFGSQNVILTDALIKSGLPRATAEMMCYFTNEDKPMKITGDTEKFLLQRLNPSEKDTKTTTVEALVYLPKDGENQEQIWCGLGSGCIVIFKKEELTKTWSFETQMSCARDRVSCLLVVNKSHVWAASFDATIYIIDRSCYKADQHLEEHSDYISVMIHGEETNMVWSGSLNGQIIGWNATKLMPVHKIKINPSVRNLVWFDLVENNFWCGIKKFLNVVSRDGDGQVTNTVSIRDDEGTLTIDSILYLPKNRILCGCGKVNKVALIDTESLEYTVITVESVEHNIGFTKMCLVGNEIWVGNRNGHIYGLEIDRISNVKNVKEVALKRTLKIHDDSVRSICVIMGGFVATGPGSKDGKIAIWRRDEETEEDMGFERVNHEYVPAVEPVKACSFPREKRTLIDKDGEKVGGSF